MISVDWHNDNFPYIKVEITPLNDLRQTKLNYQSEADVEDFLDQSEMQTLHKQGFFKKVIQRNEKDHLLLAEITKLNMFFRLL